MASSIEARTIWRSIDFSRATASAICKSSSLLALTAISVSCSWRGHARAARGRRFWLRPVARLAFGYLSAGEQGFFLDGAASEAAGSAPRLGWLSGTGLASRSIWRRFRGPQRLADERLGQYQPRLGDVAQGKHGSRRLTRLRVVAIERYHRDSA